MFCRSHQKHKSEQRELPGGCINTAVGCFKDKQLTHGRRLDRKQTNMANWMERAPSSTTQHHCCTFVSQQFPLRTLFGPSCLVSIAQDSSQLKLAAISCKGCVQRANRSPALIPTHPGGILEMLLTDMPKFDPSIACWVANNADLPLGLRR